MLSRCPRKSELFDNHFRFLIGDRFVGVYSPLGHYIGICGCRYVDTCSLVLLAATLAPALASLVVTLARAVAILLAVAATLASALLVLPSARFLAGPLAVAATLASALLSALLLAIMMASAMAATLARALLVSPSSAVATSLVRALLALLPLLLIATLDALSGIMYGCRYVDTCSPAIAAIAASRYIGTCGRCFVDGVLVRCLCAVFLR